MKTFTIKEGKEVLRLKPGTYTVLRTEIDNEHSGMWGVYEDTLVENEKGEKFVIPTGNAQLLGLIKGDKFEQRNRKFYFTVALVL